MRMLIKLEAGVLYLKNQLRFVEKFTNFLG